MYAWSGRELSKTVDRKSLLCGLRVVVKTTYEHRRAMRWTALISSSRARRKRVHLSVQAGPGYTAEVSPSYRASSMGNALAIPVQAEPGLAAVAAPSFHRSVRAGQHVHRSTRAGPGRIVTSERDG